MKYCFIFIAFVSLLCSCKRTQQTDDADVLVRVKDRTLKRSEVVSLIPRGTSSFIKCKLFLILLIIVQLIAFADISRQFLFDQALLITVTNQRVAVFFYQLVDLFFFVPQVSLGNFVNQGILYRGESEKVYT